MTTRTTSWTAARPADSTVASAVRAEVRDLVTRLVTTLATRPDDDRLLRSLVLDLPTRVRASAGRLVRTRAEGRPVVVSRFGRLPDLDDAETRALGDDRPVVLAPAEGVSILAAVRLVADGTVVGAVVLGFDAEPDEADGLADLLVVMAGIVGLHLRDAWAVPLPSDRPPHEAGAPGPELSPRQLTVLRLMSFGLSNRAIAARIGFSESTVRHETMALYRVLGVGDRRTATLVARTCGLLDQAARSVTA